MKYALTFMCFALLVSCKKDTLQDRLDGDAEVFVGKWEWIYTVEEIENNDEPSTFIRHTPTSIGFTFCIELEQEGVAVMTKDDVELGRYRMDFGEPNINVSERVLISGALYQAIENERKYFSASYYFASPDTIRFKGYPLNLPTQKRNYFKRIQ